MCAPIFFAPLNFAQRRLPIIGAPFVFVHLIRFAPLWFSRTLAFRWNLIILFQFSSIPKDIPLKDTMFTVYKQLKEKCNVLGFVFIDNASVELEHVFEDGAHLLESGLNILANNFLNTLLHFLR